MHDGNAQVQGGVVDQVTGGEVVGPVDHHVVARHQVESVVGGQHPRVCLDTCVGVEISQSLAGRFDLGHAHPVGGVEDLTLQVGDVHDVVVDEAERSDSGSGEVEGGR